MEIGRHPKWGITLKIGDFDYSTNYGECIEHSNARTEEHIDISLLSLLISLSNHLQFHNHSTSFDNFSFHYFSWYIILTELILTIFRLICYLKCLNTIVCDNGTVQFFFFFFFGVRLNIISGKSNVFVVTYAPCFSSLKLD